jgi:Ser/Thr protein kinase RdoA (MazF antagonist)
MAAFSILPHLHLDRVLDVYEEALARHLELKDAVMEAPELLAGLYGRPFSAVEPAARGPNRTFKVHTGGDPLYLRLYRREGRSRAEIEAEVAALLATDSIAARPVPLAGGGYVCRCPFEGAMRFAVLFTEAPGAPPEPTAGNLRRIASELARLHDQMRQAYPVGRPFEPETIITSACASLEALGEAFHPVISRITELRPDICARLHGAGAVRGVCHGDIWVGNVHVLGERTTFFDFDECFDGPLVADVARFLASVWERDHEDFPMAAEAICAGYGAARLPLEDWRLMPTLCQLDAINSIGFLATYCALEPSSWEECRASTLKHLADWAPDGRASAILRSL